MLSIRTASAGAILRILGLRRGQWASPGSGRLLLSDPGPWGAFWSSVARGGAGEIAAALRRQAGTDVAERPAGGPVTDPEALAGWISGPEGRS
jgi:hypothetical protein